MTIDDPISRLVVALDGPDLILSSETARLIGKFGIETCIPALQNHVVASRSYTKMASIHALGLLGGAETESVLESVFQKPNVPDDFYWYGFRSVRAAAAIELIRHGNQTGLEWLNERWAAVDPVMTRWFAPTILRLPATTPLRKQITVEALCASDLRERCDTPPYSDPAMLCLLCESLGLIEDTATVEILEFYLGFHSRFVRLQAALALCRHNPGGSSLDKIQRAAEVYQTDCDRIGWCVASGDADGLHQIASTAASDVDRAAALEALNSTFPEKALPALLEGIRDSSPGVRRSSWEFLAKSHPDRCVRAIEEAGDGEGDPFVLCTLAAIQVQGVRHVC